ncbi:MAG: CBS domain-containing protein [Actinomycetota bacterium]|nr:CBS domain-containing protein [Actinomycetota bacterium]
MTPSVECIGENDTVLDAAKMLAKLNVGSMPICGEDNRLKGMLTDRDIVVKVLAEGRDPATTKAGELGQGKPVTIGADDSIQLAIQTMADHKVRRLPVIDGHDLVGIVSQADVAKNAEDDDIGRLVEVISTGG